MRIIAGSLRSRRFEAPPGLKTRPTSDRLRETLFNVIAARIEGAALLDLYAGSGAVGIEAMSRGAARVLFVERAAAALKVLRGNLAGLGLRDGAEVRAESVAAFLRRAAGVPFDVIFLDPPYDAEGEYEKTLGSLGGNSAAVAKSWRRGHCGARRKDSCRARTERWSERDCCSREMRR